MIHGVLNVYKEKGFTSHDVVAKLRGIVGQKKIGHTGTLDPDAVGVLPVCLGKATKLCDLLTEKSKTYETVLLLGKTTDTQDISGTVLSEHAVEGIADALVREVIESFVGAYDQIPPMYSALKVNGKKLYELAREGIEIERKARRVQILDITIKEVCLPRVRMEVSCSKGTYIRTLCHDIGEKLGCGGCMEELTRTKVSMFTIENSYTLSQIEEKKQAGTLHEILMPVDAMFPMYRQMKVKKTYEQLLYNGNPFYLNQAEGADGVVDQEQVRVYDQSNRFIGLYSYDKKSRMFKIVKMFFDKEEQTRGL